MFKLRPHHLICNLSFQGKGYNESFIENFNLINKALLGDPNAKQIQIVFGIDDICSKCPKKRDGKCVDDAHVSLIDDKCRNLLQLSLGEIISLAAIETKIHRLLSINSFQEICGRCEWQYLCEANIANRFKLTRKA
jgi:uncharacterized protein